MPIDIEIGRGLKIDTVDERRVPQGWLDGPPPMIHPGAIETDEALARAAKCYLTNAVACLNEALKRGLKVNVELDTRRLNHAGGGTSSTFTIEEFTISKDLLEC